MDGNSCERVFHIRSNERTEIKTKEKTKASNPKGMALPVGKANERKFNQKFHRISDL